MNIFYKLTLLGLAFPLLFIACEDNKITSEVKDDKVNSVDGIGIKTNKIGFYHNQVLDMVYNDENINVNNLSYFEFREVIKEKLINRYPKKFSGEELEAKKLAINKGLVESGFLKFETLPKKSVNLSSTNPDFTGDYKLVIKNLRENNYISKTLSSRILKLYNNMTEWANDEDPIKYAREVVAIQSLTKEDKKYATAFLSTLESSNEYWKSSNKYKYWSDNTNLEKANIVRLKTGSAENNCESAKEQNLELIGADAAGGLYGMMGGPV